MAHWVETEARRANRNLLIWSVIGLALAVAIIVVNHDVDSYAENWFVPVFFLILLLVAGIGLFKALRRLGDVQTTPLWRQIALYGNVEQLAMQIEQEQQQPMSITKYDKLLLTPSWIVRRAPFSTWVSPLGDLAWVYKKVTRHYTNFIPTGKTYSAVIVSRHRQRIEVQMSQKKTDQLMADLATRVPWVFFGYSKEIAKQWQKNPASLIAAVDSRRQASSKAGTAGK